MSVSIRLSVKEKRLAERYAKLHSQSLEEAFNMIRQEIPRRSCPLGAKGVARKWRVVPSHEEMRERIF